MSTLERAIAIAAKSHEGQRDKAGAPYILHPLRLMLRMTTTEERITAILHDVVEDCEISLDSLRAEGFSEDVIKAIDSVTRRPEEAYETFVLRAANNPIGRRVKLADLQDNSDLSRITNPTPRDHERVEKYRLAIEAIRAIVGYTVFVDDNYHYMREEERYKYGEYPSYQEALQASMDIVDEFLNDQYKPGMSTDDLYKLYVSFGVDPFIVPSEPQVDDFSAWSYAKIRCRELCDA